MTIEVVRGRLTHALAAELVEFWTSRGALDADAAQRRLPEVVCVMRGEDGAVAGVSSAGAAEIGPLGGRRFWIFRSLCPGDRREAMINATSDALDAEYDRGPGAPIGVCLVDETHPRFLYAGRTGDGQRLHVRYFDGALIGPGDDHTFVLHPLDEGYRVEPFAEQDRVGADDLVAFWIGEGVVGEEEGRRRVDEVLLVATDPRGTVAGACSAYLEHNEQLGVELWHFRTFVGAAHRRAHVAAHLALDGRDLVEARGGAPGMVVELEHEGLQRTFNRAHLSPMDSWFIGETPSGAHVYVRWFDQGSA